MDKERKVIQWRCSICRKVSSVPIDHFSFCKGEDTKAHQWVQWEPYITGLDGTRITFLDIKPHQIKVKNIFTFLAKSCRYNGLIDGWYSNAEHLIMCTEKAPTIAIGKAVLVHDFGEAISQDIPAPIKRQFPEYRVFSNEVQDFMNFHFLGTNDIPSEVKTIDTRMTATEMLYLRNDSPDSLEAEPYDGVTFHQWEWRTALERIREVFYNYFPEYKDRA